MFLCQAYLFFTRAILSSSKRSLSNITPARSQIWHRPTVPARLCCSQKYSRCFTTCFFLRLLMSLCERFLPTFARILFIFITQKSSPLLIDVCRSIPSSTLSLARVMPVSCTYTADFLPAERRPRKNKQYKAIGIQDWHGTSSRQRQYHIFCHDVKHPVHFAWFKMIVHFMKTTRI